MKRLLLLSLCLLVLSGCRTLTVLVVNPDGSGTFTSEIEMENRYFRLLAQEGDPIAALEENAASASFPVETERLDTERSKGLRATFEFTDIDDMKEKFAELNTEETGGSTLFADATIGEEDTGWVFDAQQEGGSEAEATEEFLDPEELKKIIDASVQVTLPGAEGDTNATEVTVDDDSTTFIWELDPGSAAQLSAHTLIPHSLFEKLVGPLGAGILGGLVLIGVAVWWLKKRGKPSTEAEAEAGS